MEPTFFPSTIFVNAPNPEAVLYINGFKNPSTGFPEAIRSLLMREMMLAKVLMRQTFR